jgi:serine phosphatase RsbU (regulator of sigma subunit)
MSQARFSTNLEDSPAIDVNLYPSRSRRPPLVSRRELENRLATLQKDYAELHTAIFEAAQVHRRLCAPRHVSCGNLEIASEIFAVRHLPGDFFTVEEKRDTVVFALGDICGKGLAAGMWTTHMVGLVGARVNNNSNPADIVAGINRDVCMKKPVVPYASLFVAAMDPDTGVFSYCSAGHPPALLLRANGDLEFLSDGGMLLGVIADARYACGTFRLEAGDVLMVYSDGITESVNSAGDEFGDARLEAQLRRAHSGTSNAGAESVLFSVLGAVQDFASPSPLIDDMSLAVVRNVH